MKKAVMPSIVFSVMLLAVGVIADAQQPTKVPRIGFLATGSASTISDRVEAFRQGLRISDRVEAFRQGLRELGYVEGKKRHRSTDTLTASLISSLSHCK